MIFDFKIVMHVEVGPIVFGYVLLLEISSFDDNGIIYIYNIQISYDLILSGTFATCLKHV